MYEADGTLAEQQIGRGTLVGRYVVLSQLGRGAMGTVYSALDPDLDRRIALKVVEPRPNERRSDLSREARVLAKLEHPNVATIYDVGFWNERLYIAMELVDGGDLQQWLEQPHTPREILAAFVQAGRGLAAAHARGVVHRDFKPTNILIGSDGRVRVADFGLAELAMESVPAVGAGDSMRALVDSQIAPAGTPDFMAPEVLRGEAATARSDQHSFCVALYCALTGSVPTHASQARALPLARAARRAVARGLLADPEQRFESMPALLHTLEHATRRRRVLFAGATAIALACGIAVSVHDDAPDCHATTLAWSEQYGAQRSRDLEQELASAQASYAEDSAQRVVNVLKHFGETWSAAFEGACGDPARVAELPCLEQQRARHDALWVALEQGGARFARHALPAVAALPSPSQCTKGEFFPRRPMAPAEPDDKVAGGRVRSLLLTADALMTAGQNAAGLREAKLALEQAQALEHPALVAEALLTVARGQQGQGESAAAHVNFRRAATTAWACGHDEAMLTALSRLVVLVGRDLGDEQTGQVWSELGHALVARLGWPSTTEAAFLNADGLFWGNRGEWIRARKAYETSLALRRRFLHEHHPQILQSLSNLATVDLEEGKFDAALARSSEVVELLVTTYGEHHPSVALSRGVLGLALMRTDRVDEAGVVLERAFNDAREGLGPDHPRVASIANNLALVFEQRGEYRRAKALYLDALAAWTRTRGADDPQVAVGHFNVGGAASRLGDYEEAVQHMRAAAAIWAKTMGEDHPRVASALRGLSGVLRRTGRCDEAVVQAQRALDVLERAQETSAQTRTRTLFALGRAKLCSADLPGAEAAVNEALALARTTYGTHSVVRTTLTLLAQVMLEQGRVVEARAAVEEALKIEGAAADLVVSEFVLARTLVHSEPERAHAIAVAVLERLSPQDLRHAETRAKVLAFVEGGAGETLRP